MTEFYINLREATAYDAEILFEWRNDPITRAASIDTRIVSWDDHVNWLTSSLQKPTRLLLIAETDRPIGTIRIDHGNVVEISWTIAPRERGCGFGQKMVLAALPDKPVIARIKRDNLASRRIAEATGFHLAIDDSVQTWQRG